MTVKKLKEILNSYDINDDANVVVDNLGDRDVAWVVGIHQGDWGFLTITADRTATLVAEMGAIKRLMEETK